MRRQRQTSHSPAGSKTNTARAIVDLCQSEMSNFGFDCRKRTTLWRRTNVKFDVLKFDVIPAARCEKWRIPLGSFSLIPSCLFPFLPRLDYPRAVLDPEDGYGQIRLSVYRGISQSMVEARNIWWASDTQAAFDAVARDVFDQINLKVLPFYSRFDEPEEVLRTFLEDDDAMGREGVWEIGKIGSPTRLLYTGFAAIACSKWDLAVFNLRACEQKVMAISAPMRERVGAEILPYVAEGLTFATQKQAWPTIVRDS